MNLLLSISTWHFFLPSWNFHVKTNDEFHTISMQGLICFVWSQYWVLRLILQLFCLLVPDPRQLQQVMRVQHTVEVITRATPRKLRKRVAVVSPEIENQYMFFISAVVGTCLRSVLKSSYFQSNLRNEWSNDMRLLYIQAKQLYLNF